MLDLLHLELETEIDFYNRLAQQNRRDAVAQITLNKIEAKIKALRKTINEKESRQINSKRRDSHFIIYYVWQIMHRLRDYKNRGYHQIFRIPAKGILQTQAGVR